MRLGVWQARALSVVAGLAIALAQVPWSLLPLGLGGFAAVLWLLSQAQSWRSAAILGWCGGFGHFLLALHWIYHPFQVDPDRDAWMAPFAVVLLPAGLALFWALGGALGWGLAPRARLAGLVLALTGAEALRAHILTGFPWVLPGHIWLGWPGEQLAALVGAHGLTLWTLALAAAGVATWRMALGAGVGVVATLGLGAFLAAQPVPAPRDLTIRLIQPNAAQDLKWHPDHWREFYIRQLDLTAQEGSPDLVIWPETAVPFLLDQQVGLDQMIEASRGVPILVGIQRLDGLRGFNSLALLERGEAGAQVVAVYDKHHLVPFGEYIPFGDAMFRWLNISAFAPSQGAGYTPGPGPAMIDLGPLGRVSALICYESVFPYMIRNLSDRPDWIVQVTNDAWFGQAAGPWQHLSLARLRAIEFGLPVLRVANTGVTAGIDPRGRVVAALSLGQVGALDLALPAALAPTPYARFGDWPVWFMLLSGLVVLLVRRKH
jgi:apolipoprotein N-acyltransferase